MSEPITSTMLAKWAVLAIWSVFGGIVHALIESRKGNTKNFWDGFVLALISGFAGAMWGLLALKFFEHDIIIVAFAAGMGGFMSVEGLVLIINALKNKYLK